MTFKACVVFEDALVERLRPINLARTTSSVTCGALSLEQMLKDAGWPLYALARPHLQPATKRRGQLLAEDEIEGPILYLNAALVPDLRVLSRLQQLVSAGQPFLALRDQRITVAWSPQAFDPGRAKNLMGHLLDQRLPVIDDEFPTFDYAFDVIRHHERLLPTHLEYLAERQKWERIESNVLVGAHATIAKNVVFDGAQGLILIGNHVRIHPFSFLAGPIRIGDHSLIADHAAVKRGTSLVHTVKLGGEVEDAIIEPYSNKQHHGFLGHAYIGSWVNLGAGTSNSNLKNTYGEVGMEIDSRMVPSGMQFLGCVVGDYTKTAINTSIFTGKVLGVGSFVYGFVTTNVPSFTNYARTFGQVTEVPLDVAIKTQMRVAKRRNVSVDAIDEKLMSDLFELTRTERQLSNEQVVL